MVSQHPQNPLPDKQQQQRNTPSFSQFRIEQPWWLSSTFGYIATIPLLILSVTMTLLGELLLSGFHFPSAVLLVAILTVSLIWGVGPGLFAMVLSCLALFFFFIAPVGGLHLLPQNWELLFQLIPFAMAGVVVAVITGQRERARRQALHAEQIAHDRADEVARTNQELLRANQLKDLFVSITSHELKTPITSIRGHAQLAVRRINRRPEPDAEAAYLRDAFVKVDQQGRRLTELLDELLDLSSLRSGKVALEKELCNLNDICLSVIEEQRELSGRSIQLTLPSEPVQLQANTRRIGQVITNLVNNALKYSPPDAPVRVEVSSNEACACIGVQDSGDGISPEQLPNIFQPFYRTSDARASKVSGTGLGLAICKEIIEQHQGRIWCESCPGHGSTFFVELPLPAPSSSSC